MNLGPRRLLVDDLTRYAEYWEAQSSAEYRRYLEFVVNTEDCCCRTHLAGHCTGSALVVSPNYGQVLLLFHPFLQRWLQPGGHADGQTDLLEVAQREAHEESGLALADLQAVSLGGRARVPLDLDIHEIPARKSEPEHLHYDLRYLFVADPSLPLTPESEHLRLEWIPLSEVNKKTQEESVLRMLRKLSRLTPPE